jgi:hypothetical protein
MYIIRTGIACYGLPVPLLHLDTLPDACGFLADRAALLRCVCTELNKLFHTQWPVRPMKQLHAHVHLCGPSMQTDAWSCGYRLLHGWTAVLAVMRQTGYVTPELFNRACKHAEQQTSLQQMIDQARTLYDEAGSHEEVCGRCCALVGCKSNGLLQYLMDEGVFTCLLCVSLLQAADNIQPL